VKSNQSVGPVWCDGGMTALWNCTASDDEMALQSLEKDRSPTAGLKSRGSPGSVRIRSPSAVKLRKYDRIDEEDTCATRPRDFGRFSHRRVVVDHPT